MAQMIVTPRGLRPSEHVREVGPGEEVVFEAGGLYVVNRATGARQRVGAATGGGRDDKRDHGGAQTAEFITRAIWANDSQRDFTAIRASWVVPPLPVIVANQNVLLILAVLNATEFACCCLTYGKPTALDLVPVWSIQAWFINETGAMHSPSTRVRPGETLDAEIVTQPRADGTVGFLCGFSGYPVSRNVARPSVPFSHCAVELHTLNVDDCQKYPAGEHVTIRNINVLTGERTPAVHWLTENAREEDRRCREHTNIVVDSGAGGQVEIHFSPCPRLRRLIAEMETDIQDAMRDRDSEPPDPGGGRRAAETRLRQLRERLGELKTERDRHRCGL